METKRVNLARFVDFDVTLTNVLPWQPDVRFPPKFFFFLEKFLENKDWQLFVFTFPAGKIKLDFLENPSSTLLGYSRMSNLIQAHFWDFLEIACWYWPDLAIIQATKLGLARISLNFRQKCGFQENSSFSNSQKIQAQC